jgi:arabinose-5-phosphate isomerase
MHGAEELPICSLDCPMAEAILIMTAKRFGCVGVVDDSGTLTGIITDGDLPTATCDGIWTTICWPSAPAT